MVQKKQIKRGVKRGVKKIEQKLSTRRAVMVFWCVVLAPFVLLGVMLTLTAVGTFGALPTFEELENPQSNMATEIISEDGKTLGTFYEENRTFVDYADLPRDIVEALVATEDVRFYGHSGIDFISLGRVALRTIGLGQDQGGGSTITQQLAKNLFPRQERSQNPVVRIAVLITDKLKEWITALKLEYNYTKEEIIAMYLNTVFYGSNAYGVKSAANTFFGKMPANLNLQESAMLVGVVNAPTKYSPVSNPDNAVARRNTVIRRMESTGYITRGECDSLAALPIELNYNPASHDEGSATYFREMLRLVMQAKKPTRNQYYTKYDYEYELKRWEANPIYGWCHKNLKADSTPYDIYRDGLKIYTTINSTMQRYAELAVSERMRNEIQPQMDNQFKWRGRIFEDRTKKQIDEIIFNAMRYSDRYRAMEASGATKEQIDDVFNRPVPMKLFSYSGIRDTILSPRDSIVHFKKLMRASFVAVEPGTGHIKAYVGGPNFKYFKYDYAKQAKRQCGSTIKPFVYTYAFSQLGFDPCTPVPNLPVTIETYSKTPWSPKEATKVEYDGVYHPLKWGLANSRNNYTAWIMQHANPEAVADFIHNMGIRSFIDPVHALALGSMDVSLYELVGAFTTFANEGVSIEPIFVVRIEDRQGNLISSFLPETTDAISEVTAYTTLQVLQDVVNGGTGGRLRYHYNLKGELGGKTGTSQENRDAWFIGVAPKLVAGAWVGGEDQSVHPTSSGDGARMALPIYGEFMRRVYADPSLGITEQDKFKVPPGARFYGCAEVARMEPVDISIKTDDFFD